MEGVILAAGFGNRFDFKDKTFKKYLLPIKNSILLNYVIAGMVNANIEKINIVVDKNANKQIIIKSALNFIESIIPTKKKISINLRENLYPERENGFSLYLGSQEVTSDFFIMSMADHIFSVNIFSELIKYYNNEDVILATDPMEIKGAYDLDDCTKVYGENSKIIEIGKQISNYNRLDMGAFIMNTQTIQRVSQEVEKQKQKFGVSDVLIKSIQQRYRINYQDFKNTIWIDIDNDIEYNKLKDIFNKNSKYYPFNLKIE